jgi:hypothetical protein
MKPSDPFWNDAFHWCVLAAGFLAASEGRLQDSEYVRELAYQWFKEGAFRDRTGSSHLTTPPPNATAR